MAESLQLSPYDQSFPPIISKRSPTTRDKAELGTLWINTALNDAFILTSVVAGAATWISTGGGSGTFSTLAISGASVFNGAMTISTFGKGILLSSAAGLLSVINGTNGQLIIGSTSGSPAWASLASDGSIAITNTSNGISLAVTGATTSSYITNSGTATPNVGALTVNGDGVNITTSGSSHTVTVTLANSVSVSGSLTAGVGLNMNTGTCTIASNTNAAQAIYLNTNAGVNETIELYAAQGTSATSINIHSLAGGVTLASAKASATAINLTASNAAGGATITAGTGGVTYNITNGTFAVNTGTGAVNIGTDSVAKAVTLGSVTGGSAAVLQSGSGNTSITSTGTIGLTSNGAITIESTGGTLSLGASANAQNINIGIGAAARTITLGNATGGTSVIVNGGTGAMSFGANAIAHTTTIGSTATSAATVIQGGTGGIAINAAGIVTMTPATDSQAAATVTINANVGSGTFTGLTTAAAGTQVLTVTNSICTTTSAILCTIASVGAEDAQLTIQRVKPLAGSFTVTYKNNGAAALNSNIILTFWIIKA